MGTTIVAGLFFDDRLTVAHVGDSRLYRWRAGQLEQITQDHSLLQELVSRGFYSPQEAARAASKNYVTRALGVETSVDVDIRDVDVQPGDLYLLCSDGLSDMVEDEDIHLTISTFGANLETLARQLVLLSNDNGGRDNVSIVLVRVNDSFPARRGLVQRFRNLFN
jgi:protein phosphatase